MAELGAAVIGARLGDRAAVRAEHGVPFIVDFRDALGQPRGAEGGVGGAAGERLADGPGRCAGRSGPVGLVRRARPVPQSDAGSRGW